MKPPRRHRPFQSSDLSDLSVVFVYFLKFFEPSSVQTDTCRASHRPQDECDKELRSLEKAFTETCERHNGRKLFDEHQGEENHRAFDCVQLAGPPRQHRAR